MSFELRIISLKKKKKKKKKMENILVFITLTEVRRFVHQPGVSPHNANLPVPYIIHVMIVWEIMGTTERKCTVYQLKCFPI